jgi:hypothetical protein
MMGLNTVGCLPTGCWFGNSIYFSILVMFDRYTHIISTLVFSRERSSTGSNDCFVVVVLVLVLVLVVGIFIL